MSDSTQTPRQRVLTALTHRQPQRVPFSWGFGPTAEMQQVLSAELARQGLDWPRLRAATDDVRSVHLRYAGPPRPERTDFWGVRRKPVAYGGGQYNEFEHYPLAGLDSPAAVAAHPWPDPDAFDYAGLARDIEQLQDDNAPRAVRCLSGNPFEIYSWMVGLEEALINLATEPDLVHAALEPITAFWLARLERIAAVAGERIDLWFFADDLGSQAGPLLSPASYRAVLMPYHRRLFQAARRLTPRARLLYHSDGSVAGLLDALIEAGIDVLEACQVECAGMDPATLKSRWGDRLSFHGAISVQQLLPRADAATVRTECRRLVEILGAGGGYIAAPSHAVQVGTPVENVLAMLQAVLGDEDYAQALQAAAL